MCMSSCHPRERWYYISFKEKTKANIDSYPQEKKKPIKKIQISKIQKLREMDRNRK